MVRNPRVQEELDAVVGRDRLPTIEDMPNLPCTETTILETLRLSNIVPLATTHSPTKDVHLNGYRIPAGSQVIPLINYVHMDPNRQARATFRAQKQQYWRRSGCPALEGTVGATIAPKAVRVKFCPRSDPAPAPPAPAHPHLCHVGAH